MTANAIKVIIININLGKAISIFIKVGFSKGFTLANYPPGTIHRFKISLFHTYTPTKIP